MKKSLALILLLVAALSGWAQGFLIVGCDGQQQALAPFVEWKRAQGYDVRELYLEELSRDSVQTLVRRYCDTASPRPEYMLLVGGTAIFPPFFSAHQPAGLDLSFTDLPYCDLDGDLRPDLMLGRLPVSDTGELAAVVRKTLRYEQGLMDTAHLGRALLMAGYECIDPAPEFTNGQVRLLAEGFAGMGMDTVCFYNPGLDELPEGWEQARRDSVLRWLGHGAGHVNYTGHGKFNRWVHPTVSANDVASLPDNDRYCFLVSNCCRACDFGGSSLGEAFLRHPSSGAACVVGATNETLWQEDYDWAMGAYGAYFRAEVRTAGEMLRAGCQAVEESGSPFADFYWETYVLLGDPTLEPRIGTPVPLELGGPQHALPYALEVYPNPASDRITVNAPYRLLDLYGREVTKELRHLPNGIYIVQAAHTSKRLIVQH